MNNNNHLVRREQVKLLSNLPLIFFLISSFNKKIIKLFNFI
jgi:hypothetical protein